MRIASLHIYPVKSCGGVSLEEVSLDARGLVGDRRWMVVDARGVFVTQRELPALARVQVERAEGGWRLREEAELVVRDDDAPERCEVVVWGDRIDARLHREGSRFFTERFRRPLRLVRFDETVTRLAGRSARDLEGGPATVAFADAYPMLVIGQASLDELNGRLAAPVPMRRFRPNVVVEGAAPFAEDDWARLRLGPVDARMVKRCDRCSIVTVDDTGRRHKEPLATLATYRRDGARVLFGVNVAHRGRGTLRLGDPVTLLP